MTRGPFPGWQLDPDDREHLELPPPSDNEEARPRARESVFGFWTPRRRFWKWLHGIVNRLAWRFAAPSDHVCTEVCGLDRGKHPPHWGRGLRIDNDRLLWRLNDWLAPHWSDDWIAWRVAESRRNRP
jgi:hypothetical protein